MNELTLGSLFDGSGGFPLGGLLEGITPLWASEIEPFPIRVTTKRLPFMKHLGDISKLNGAELPPVDILTFGSPCTDMSIAGKRAGLDGKQSVFFYEAIRIIREMRCATDGRYPKHAVWENVPGAFSSNNGADFKAVLDALVQIKEPGAEVPPPENGGWPYADILVGAGWSVAYRTLDAQYFGVAQRRRRVYAVASFDDERAGDILFKSEGLSGYSPKSFRPWQGTAGHLEEGAGTAVGFEPDAIKRMSGHAWNELAGTLRADMGDNQSAVAIENHPTDGRCRVREDGTVQTLTSRMGTGGMNVPLVMDTPKTLKVRSGCNGGGKGALVQDDISATLSCNNDQTLFVPKAYGICSDGSNSMKSDNPHSGIYEAETARTLDGNGGNPSCNQGGIAVVAVQGSMIGRADKNGPHGNGVSGDICFTLDTVDRHAVVYSMTTGEYTQICEEQASTLMARDYKDPQIVNVPDEPEYIVRRLTPSECALLQGFPEDWCSNVETAEPSEDEICWWADVFETHRLIMRTSTKPKSRCQIIKWLRNPHSDAAEYKMWGNGVALPCVRFVFAGIVENEKRTK